jgi:hypothetical protein
MAKGRKTGGRQKGTPNKVTAEMREAFRQLIEGEVDELRAALHEVRFGIEIEKQVPSPDGKGTVTVVGRLNADPKGYLDTIGKLAEFCIPKLARSEHVGEDGGPMEFVIRDLAKE